MPLPFFDEETHTYAPENMEQFKEMVDELRDIRTLEEPDSLPKKIDLSRLSKKQDLNGKNIGIEGPDLKALCEVLIDHPNKNLLSDINLGAARLFTKSADDALEQLNQIAKQQLSLKTIDTSGSYEFPFKKTHGKQLDKTLEPRALEFTKKLAKNITNADEFAIVLERLSNGDEIEQIRFADSFALNPDQLDQLTEAIENHNNKVEELTQGSGQSIKPIQQIDLGPANMKQGGGRTALENFVKMLQKIYIRFINKDKVTVGSHHSFTDLLRGIEDLNIKRKPVEPTTTGPAEFVTERSDIASTIPAANKQEKSVESISKPPQVVFDSVESSTNAVAKEKISSISQTQQTLQAQQTQKTQTNLIQPDFAARLEVVSKTPFPTPKVAPKEETKAVAEAEAPGTRIASMIASDIAALALAKEIETPKKIQEASPAKNSEIDFTILGLKRQIKNFEANVNAIRNNQKAASSFGLTLFRSSKKHVPNDRNDSDIKLMSETLATLDKIKAGYTEPGKEQFEEILKCLDNALSKVNNSTLRIYLNRAVVAANERLKPLAERVDPDKFRPA